MANRMRGQASIELLTIMGVSLAVIMLFSVLAMDTMSHAGRQHEVASAQDAVQNLAAAADAVAAQGPGAARTVIITLPASTVFNSSLTYVGKPANYPPLAEPKSININLGDTDAHALASVPLSGSFPPAPGTYKMRVVCRGDYVSVRPYIVDLDRYSVYVQMGPGQSRSEIVRVYSASAGFPNATVVSSWGFSDVAFSVSPISLSATPAGAPITLTFTTSSSAGGIYSSELVVEARDASTGANDTFSIPVSVHVQ